MKPWIVIPTYNESKNIEQLIDELFNLEIQNLSVLIVDDSSPDKTGDIVKRLQHTHPNLYLETRPKKSGLGRAYIHGFTYALDHQATHIVQMDADFSHNPNDIPKLLKALTDSDLAIGSRYSQGISVINWPLRRLFLSVGANLYAKIVTGIPVKDATGGFKAWRAETLREINLPTIKADGYGFQVVMNFRAWKKGKKITEVAIIFTERREGQSKMNKKIMFEALWLVIKLRIFGG